MPLQLLSAVVLVEETLARAAPAGLGAADQETILRLLLPGLERLDRVTQAALEGLDDLTFRRVVAVAVLGAWGRLAVSATSIMAAWVARPFRPASQDLRSFTLKAVAGQTTSSRQTRFSTARMA
jgi:hypothetical protein